MDDIRQLNLAQLKQLIQSNDELMVGNYISQNLVVARNVQVSVIAAQFSGTPTLLPEMRILLITRGSARMTLNMIDHNITAGDLLYLGTNGIIQYRQASPDIQALGISMSDDLFQLAIGNSIPGAFDGHLRDFQLHLQPREASFYDNIHHMIHQHTGLPGHSSQVTLHLLSALLWFVNHLWQQHEQSSSLNLSREQRLFSHFVQLASRYAPEHHTIDFYARHLCLTPRYLSTIIRQVSGKTAKQWIDDALITRIKIELRHSSKPIATIADDMNFPNPSFFVKFFKRMTGITPSQFRR